MSKKVFYFFVFLISLGHAFGTDLFPKTPSDLPIYITGGPEILENSNPNNITYYKISKGQLSCVSGDEYNLNTNDQDKQSPTKKVTFIKNRFSSFFPYVKTFCVGFTLDGNDMSEIVQVLASPNNRFITVLLYDGPLEALWGDSYLNDQTALTFFSRNIQVKK
jgi:hypothetical protein